MTHETTLIRDDGEITATVTAHYYKGCKGARDGPGGPPLEPDEPAEWIVDEVVNDSGESVEIDGDEERRIAEELGDPHDYND